MGGLRLAVCTRTGKRCLIAVFLGSVSAAGSLCALLGLSSCGGNTIGPAADASVTDSSGESDVGAADGPLSPFGPWPMRRRDPARTARSFGAGPQQPIVRWRAPTDAGSLGAWPIAIGPNDTTYVLTISGIVGGDASTDQPSSLVALSADGTEHWRVQLPFHVYGGEYGGEGVTSMPEVLVGSRGDLYVATYEGVAAVTSDGSLLWQRTDLGPALAIGADGTLYSTCNAAQQRSLCAIAPESGKTIWTGPSMAYLGLEMAVGPDGVVYVGTGGAEAYEEDGGLLWAIALNQPCYAPMVAAGGKTIWACGSDNGSVQAVAPDGGILWQVVTGGTPEAPALGADGTIYVAASQIAGGSSRLYAVAADGGLLWAVDGPDGGYVDVGEPALGSDGTIYVMMSEGELRAVAPDGGTRWTMSPPGISQTGEGVGFGRTLAIAADGSLRVGTTGPAGAVYAIGP